MHHYFKPVSDSLRKQCLPKPDNKNLADAGIDNAMIRAANEEIMKEINQPSTSDAGPSGASKQKKRGQYSYYSPQKRAKIGKYAAEFGVNAAARKFTKELKKPVNESSVRGMKKAYLKELKKSQNPDVVTHLPKQARGRPLLLTKEADQQVQRFIRAIRESGGVVSTRTVIATAKGLFKKANPPILVEYGGPLKLGKPWARSLLQRMGFVKRKGTKSAKHLPEEFEKIEGKFHRRIGRRVRKYNIPDELIINWDQTGVEVIPSGNWTLINVVRNK